MKYKYPRTYHLPWSPGLINDDKMLPDINCFKGKTIIATEKMDGENTTMYNDFIHARSLDSKDHPSRSYVKGIWGNIRHEIPIGWRICGENLYAKHSLFYEDLESYFQVFSIWDESNNCLSWEDTKDFCKILGLIPVKTLVGPVNFDIFNLQEFCENIDTNVIEGIVVRNVEFFHYNKFTENVAKWVRKGHIQTDEHWMNQKVVPNKLK